MLYYKYSHPTKNCVDKEFVGSETLVKLNKIHSNNLNLQTLGYFLYLILYDENTAELQPPEEDVDLPQTPWSMLSYSCIISPGGHVVPDSLILM